MGGAGDGGERGRDGGGKFDVLHGERSPVLGKSHWGPENVGGQPAGKSRSGFSDAGRPSNEGEIRGKP